MINIKFFIFDNLTEKTKKVILSVKFSSKDVEKAQNYINNLDFKDIFKYHKIDSRFRPYLTYIDSCTGEKSFSCLD